MTTDKNNARNLSPHAEARIAMVVWSSEYADQNGGSMDFWDNLSLSRKRLCRDVVDGIIHAFETTGRWEEPK